MTGTTREAKAGRVKQVVMVCVVQVLNKGEAPVSAVLA
jgi:hypothetical protein